VPHAVTDPRYPTPALHWHVPAPGRLRCESLDTLTLAFDRESGQTHLLSAPLPELLELLAAAPATTAELVARMSAAFDLGDQDAVALVSERLHELAAMGLVEAR